MRVNRKLIIGGIYKHYKGTIIKVLGVVKHIETLEDIVHYIHLKDGFEWVRPKDTLLEKINKDKFRVTEFEQSLKIYHLK